MSTNCIQQARQVSLVTLLWATSPALGLHLGAGRYTGEQNTCDKARKTVVTRDRKSFKVVTTRAMWLRSKPALNCTAFL